MVGHEAEEAGTPLKILAVDDGPTSRDALAKCVEVLGHEQSPWTKVAVITAHGSIESAVEAVRRGAIHQLAPPWGSTIDAFG